MIEGIFCIVFALIWFGYILKLPFYRPDKDFDDSKYVSDKVFKASEKFHNIKGSIGAGILLVLGLGQLYNTLAIKFGWTILF